MSVFKCKMCGGTVEFAQGDTVGICDSCGTKQTLPRLDDDKKANLYDRANHFRRNNDFDKAMSIYEQILSEDGTDSEAYWSLVLCRYGIEYVEDPATHKRVPTVNRAQFTSIFDDEDYKSALQYASAAQREVYEQEATAINEIQKGILAISQKEDPFDVFICYKESDSSGRRTPDSVLANDLYHQLTAAGFKVFFARITLEDKLGTAYEPYIFAALNSAKVMVVLGTRAEYFNAVWVKNEWSRFLALVKKSGGKKALIPAYRDMDPYDLPEEFSHLQAQDMSKLGFMQDLIRGIEKILNTEKPQQTVVTAVESNAGTAPLLKRAFMFLEDCNWQEADEYCEKVLDRDPECAEAYLGKLLAELKLQHKEDLEKQDQPFNNSNNYQKAVRFGSEELKGWLKLCLNKVAANQQEKYKQDLYNKTAKAIETACNVSTFKKLAADFEKIIDYKNARELREKCLKKADDCQKECTYNLAISFYNSRFYVKALNEFQKIPDWKDATEYIKKCNKNIEKARLIKKVLTKGTALIAAVGAVTVAVVLLITQVIVPKVRYQSLLKVRDKETADQIFALKAGDSCVYGKYEQDNNTQNGKEPIEWVVLENKGSRLLLISKCVLEYQPFNTKNAKVTWENCSLRTWLNEDFFKAAFTEEEQKQIKEVNLPAHKNPKYNFDSGNATKDKVFALSVKEAEKYFNTDMQKMAPQTEFAKSKGKSITHDATWWLRTTGNGEDCASIVETFGTISYYGCAVNYNDIGVRPAIWLDFQKDNQAEFKITESTDNATANSSNSSSYSFIRQDLMELLGVSYKDIKKKYGQVELPGDNYEGGIGYGLPAVEGVAFFFGLSASDFNYVYNTPPKDDNHCNGFSAFAGNAFNMGQEASLKALEQDIDTKVETEYYDGGPYFVYAKFKNYELYIELQKKDYISADDNVFLTERY